MSRLEPLKDAFLSPQMENLSILTQQIQQIWDEMDDSLYCSSIRVGKTGTESYAQRVESSLINDASTPTEQIVQDLSFYLQGLLKWNAPGVMINVNPPPFLLSVAATACCSVFNPNLAMDVPSGNLAFAELEVVKMLSDLVHWDYQDTAGVMTFGGKGTVLYAIRTGLHAACPTFRKSGITERVKVFSTEQGHPCHYENCEWLGIGQENCVRLPVDAQGQIDLSALRQGLHAAVQNNEKIACIIVNGGSTLYTTIDEIKQVVQIRDALVEQYQLPYRPHIHVDSVIGWAWLMFEGYDFAKNELEFSAQALQELSYVLAKVQDIHLADSFGVDFHKTGFSPYLCSTFVCKDKRRLYALGEENQPSLSQMEFGLYAPFSYTLESSRPATAALSAWLSLKRFGRDGFRRIIGTLVETGCDMRTYFDSRDYAKCCNISGHGFAALAMLFPKELRGRTNQPLEAFSDQELLQIAKYNHTFYLYLLSMQSQEKIDFALDYVSKQTQVREIQIGVIKLYPMSPFCDLEYLASFYKKFEALLDGYDASWTSLHLMDSPYRPKPFVTR